MWAALAKFVGGRVLTAIIVVASGASMIWFWKHPEALRAIWQTLKLALGWLGFALVLPWATFFVPVKVVKLESNGAAAAMLIGYLLMDAVMVLWLADWGIDGALTWVVVLLGLATAGVYNFLVCDYLAERVDEIP